MKTQSTATQSDTTFTAMHSMRTVKLSALRWFRMPSRAVWFRIALNYRRDYTSYAVVAPLFSSIFIFKSHAHYSFSFICGRFIIGPRVMARQRCSTHRNSVSARALHDVLSARQAMSKRTPRLESKPMPLEFVWLEGGCKSNTT